MRSKTVLYTINKCPSCETVKKWLADNEIELPVVVLKKKDGIWHEKTDEKWKPVPGIKGFPTLFVDEEKYEGSTKIIEYLGGLNDRN